MPVIYDEVFCGLWRLGVESTRELLGEDPDVSCYAKLLTGGLVPMAATVATERVFDAFSGAKVSRSAGQSVWSPATELAGLIFYLSRFSFRVGGCWNSVVQSV